MAFSKTYLAVLAVALSLAAVAAYPEGVPPEACISMDPSEGHDGVPNTDPCIYATIPLSTSIPAGGDVVINLLSLNGTAFKGYFTMAFDASLPDSIDPIGTFGTPSDGQTVDCFDGTANAISHTDNNSFKKDVTATWTAPAGFVGTVVFKTTFVRGGVTYWVKVPSTSNVTVGTLRGKLLHPSQLSQ